MTIKHFNKNISAENKNILTNATLSNGILTFTVENLIEDGANRIQSPISIDLSEHKLKLKIISSARLTELASSQSAADIKERESYIFLVPFSADEEGTYREYIWIIENEGQQNESGKFEIIGSTRVDLTNYIQKSNGTNLLLTDGTNIAQSTFAQATALTSKEDTSNKVKSWSATTTDTNYPSEKLVKDSLDLKADSSLLSTVATTGDYDDLSDKPNIPKVFYGTSGTSANTQTKVVTTSSDFSLESGVILFVKFSNAQDYNGTTGSELKLKVNDGSSINVVLNNSGNANAFTTRYVWQGGEVVGFVYIGTRFLLLDRDRATTTYYGVTKLTDSTSSTSTTTSATPNSVKTAYDLANSREDPSNKVTAMSSSSTDTQYPSAKAVYDALPKTTKTLTVTYTNGTTEDIEFYVR